MVKSCGIRPGPIASSFLQGYTLESMTKGDGPHSIRQAEPRSPSVSPLIAIFTAVAPPSPALAGDQHHNQGGDQGAGDRSPFDERYEPFISLGCALHISFRSHALSLSVCGAAFARATDPQGSGGKCSNPFAGILLSSSLPPLKPERTRKSFRLSRSLPLPSTFGRQFAYEG